MKFSKDLLHESLMGDASRTDWLTTIERRSTSLKVEVVRNLTYNFNWCVWEKCRLSAQANLLRGRIAGRPFNPGRLSTWVWTRKHDCKIVSYQAPPWLSLETSSRQTNSTDLTNLQVLSVSQQLVSQIPQGSGAWCKGREGQVGVPEIEVKEPCPACAWYMI